MALLEQHELIPDSEIYLLEALSPVLMDQLD